MEGDERTLFTLEEAIALLPHVREQIEAIQAHKRDLDEVEPQIEAAEARAGSNGHSDSGRLDQLQKRALAARAAMAASLADLRGVGCEVKSIDLGLVDFPSERQGRVVYLCWRLGEDTISYWHDLDTGFTGRRPL